LKINSEQSKL